ncbi:MAG: hypothetical protein R2940_12400 [Syntrophotaleaceae bacterium]
MTGSDIAQRQEAPQNPQTEKELIPPGIYQAELTRVLRYQTLTSKRVGFEFTIRGGPADGAVIIQSAVINYNPKSRLTATIKALCGNEQVRPSKLRYLVGTKRPVLVIQGKSRHGTIFNYIDRILPAETV